jgi:hypothetical protein
MYAEPIQHDAIAQDRPDPRARLNYLKGRIRDCQRRAGDTLPAQVELGAHLLQVRDQKLYELDGARSIHVWSKEHHGIERTWANTFLKLGASFTPAQVEGRSLSVDCAYQIALAPEALREPLLDLAAAMRITAPAVMRRCSQAAAAVYGETGDEEEALRAARAARAPQVEYADQLRGSVRRVERLLERLDQAEEVTQADRELLAEVQARLDSLVGRVRSRWEASAPPERVEVRVEPDEARPAPPSAEGPPPEGPPTGSSGPPADPAEPGELAWAPPVWPEEDEVLAGDDEFLGTDEEEEEFDPQRVAMKAREGEEKLVRILTSPLREVWEAAVPPVREYPVLHLDLVGHVESLAKELAQENAGGASRLAREIWDSGLRRLDEQSPLLLYCRVLIATMAIYRQVAVPEFCDVKGVLDLCQERPDLLPASVRAHALHILGAERAAAPPYEEARLLLMEALRCYDEQGGVETMRRFHLLQHLQKVLEALGDPRAEEIKARCQEVERRPGSWRVKPEKPLFPWMI